jgi:hypothetical protein
MMLGGVIWGTVADIAGIQVTLIGAGLGTFILNILTSRMSLKTIEPSATI